MNTTAWLKIIAGSLLTYSALTQLFQHRTWWFIQNVNLIFHEAGHVLFMFFGDTLHALGGSLTEILIPLLVVLYFTVKRAFLSAAVCSWWLSTAFLSVSIYAADAGERALPLLGGSAVKHDWFHLLLQWNLLHHDDAFGYAFWLGGLLSVVALCNFVYLSIQRAPQPPLRTV